VSASSGCLRRLLLVSHRPLEYAGPGTVRWRYLIDALPTHGWGVDVLSARANPTQDELAIDPRAAALARARARVMGGAGRVLRSSYSLAGIRPEAFPPHTLWTLSGRRALERRLAASPPDVVVPTVPPMSALFLCARELRGRFPLVLDMRDNWAGHPSYDAGGTLLRRVEARALAAADRIAVVTAGMVDKLTGLHPDLADRVRLLPNGYDPRLLARRRAHATAWPERVTLIHPGVLYGDRGVNALLDALARPELRGRVRLELVGNVTPGTAAAVRRAGDAVDVVLTPPQTWEGAIARVEDADVVAVIVPASMGDDVAWPVKLFEALALGKPVLSVTAGGGTETLLRELGQDHATARDGDADSIAAALVRLLEGAPPAPVDPDRIERWDRSRIAAEYAALLDEVAR
jgi:glycosyltransferase involved in cell wall biosynthesis